MSKLILLGAFLLSAGCTTVAPTAGKKVPREHRGECRKVCDGLDLKLSAMVIVAGASGCVCEVPDSKNMSKASGTSGVAGGVVMAIQEQQRRAAQQQQSSGHH